MRIGGKNIGEVDKAVRAIIGIALLAAYVANYLAFPWSYVALAVGLVMIATAAYETCQLYAVLGISTRAKKAKE
jgi:hypothetical protein